MVVRSWLVIPIGGSVAAAIALMLERAPAAAVAIGLAAAAMTATVRALAGHSPASVGGGLVAAALVAFGVAEARPALAIAAAGFAIVELMRATPRSWLPALAAAFVAGVLDPSFVALAPVVGIRLRGPRWTLIAPAIGALVVGLAAIAAFAWPSLWQLWSGRALAPRPVDDTIVAIGDSLGAIASFAAVAGLVLVPRRGLVAVAVAATAVIVDARAGHVGAASAGVAAFAAGLAISRLAAIIRMPVGQACAAAAAGFIAVGSLALQSL